MHPLPQATIQYLIIDSAKLLYSKSKFFLLEKISLNIHNLILFVTWLMCSVHFRCWSNKITRYLMQETFSICWQVYIQVLQRRECGPNSNCLGWTAMDGKNAIYLVLLRFNVSELFFSHKLIVGFCYYPKFIPGFGSECQYCIVSIAN